MLNLPELIRPLIVGGFLLFFLGNLRAQQVELSGVISDSLQQPLPNTNIIASPMDDGGSINFAISDEKGRYRINLAKDKTFGLEIIHLGFSKITDTVRLSETTARDFTMFRSVEPLEEIRIEQRMAVVVKEDTITYRVEQFNTGEERKLREVLKNLPGVEVSRQGDVTINGKKVTKLMVEGKTFFTGDTKLGVNNIPADVVQEVVAIENYNEVAFLKGLRDSDQVALNIKLKEGKKRFAFGDLEVGAGVEERYLLAPTLFYYSPNTAVNVIGDLNNIGVKSFGMDDYINFEGGYESLLESSSVAFNEYRKEFMDFLDKEDFVNSRNDFGAGSISQQLSTSLRVDAYTILSGGEVETRVTDNLRYLTETGVDEFRETAADQELFFTLNKLKLRYRPDAETDASYDVLVKTSKGTAEQELVSETLDGIHNTRSIQVPVNLEVNQFLNYNKSFSYEHTSTLSASYRYQDNKNGNDWYFDRPVFPGNIPFEEEGELYHLLQKTNSKIHNVQLDLKHYWVLNNLNHIYPNIGINLYDQGFSSVDQQQFPDGRRVSFQDFGFNNDLVFRLWEVYGGFEYKVKWGNLVMKPGLSLRRYHWKVKQFGELIENDRKSVLLPSLRMEYELGSSENLKFDYSMKSNFSDAASYANRLRLLNFNQLFKGNENLANELSHSFVLRYYQFNLFRSLFLNANLSYTRRAGSVRRTTLLDGIDQIITLIYSEAPENAYFGGASVAKQFGKLKFSLSGSMNLSDYSRLINAVHTEYASQNFRTTLKAETRFKKFPNLEVGYRQDYSIFESEDYKTDFIKRDPYMKLEYDFLNDFILKADYVYNYYQNLESTQNDRFQVGNASLYYNKEDNPWSFEINIRNLFDVSYRNSNSFNEFLITDQRIFLQPRSVMFIVGYKF